MIKSVHEICFFCTFVEIKLVNVMVTVRIKETSKQAKLLLEYMKSLDFVEFENESLLSQIETGLQQVKFAKDNNVKRKTLSQLLDEK
jgi:hypothetical protein